MFFFLLFLGSLSLSAIFARSAVTIPYFPQQHPWDIDDQKSGRYVASYDSKLAEFKDRPEPNESIKVSLPIYEKLKGGFVPPELSGLDKVYWWDKRFNTLDVSPSDDLPYFEGVDEDNDMDDYHSGSGVMKRDYNAAQLVNMLKALAKARRHRQIRITGKGLRFGISR